LSVNQAEIWSYAQALPTAMTIERLCVFYDSTQSL